MPWFHRQASGVLTPYATRAVLSGWRAVGLPGTVVLGLLAVVAVAWAVLRRSPSGVWLVGTGGLALVVVTTAAVERVGGEADCCGPGTVTTTPTLGLAVAYAGALAVILVGLVVLVGEARRRSRPD